MAIPAMALLLQHDARRDILIEPAARRRASIEARGHSELGAQSGRSKKRRDDGTTGQTTGHLAARGSASRYMARRKATRQATELTTV